MVPCEALTSCLRTMAWGSPCRTFAVPPAPAVKEVDLRSLNVPVTITLGNQSRVFYRIAAYAAHALLPSAKLKIVENARHLWPVQDPRAFSNLVLDFLDSD